MIDMNGHTLYYRITQAGGKSRVACARVWDSDRFLEAQRVAGARADKPEDRFTVAPASKEEFKAQ